MTDQELIDILREDYKNIYERICLLQKEIFKEMQNENDEGNMYSSKLYLKFINKLQDLIDR